MSIVAIAPTLGSLGDEIGRALARSLSWDFADREIILEAAGRFGEGVMTFEHVTEEKPSLWERVADTHHHYVTFVEAIVLEMASRDDVVLVGRGAPYILRPLRHALRVRVTAPEALRARRVESQQGLTADAARHLVHQSDHERGARVRFFYHVDWNDGLAYDLLLNTERMDVEEGARLIRETLAAERWRSTPESRALAEDLALGARSRAALLAHPETRHLRLSVSCRERQVTVAGLLDREEQRKSVEQVVAALPGVAGVALEVTAARPLRPAV
jgi:cytidylate kinase